MAERDTYAHGGASVAKGSKKTTFERKALSSDLKTLGTNRKSTENH